MWLYVVESGDTLPILVELNEFTNYSVQIAVFDSNNTLCVFSEPIIALTGILPLCMYEKVFKMLMHKFCAIYYTKFMCI